ncbi:MAG: ABC-three component system protein [Sedimentisphaerales bacterium]
MPDSISQKNITAEKVVGRDDNSTTVIQFIKNVIRQPLKKLINKLRKEMENENKITNTNEHPVLNFYQADIDTIGLEGKMKKAKKEDKLKRAMAYKEFFAKELTKKKFYRAGQELYAILLGKVYSGFNQQIKPLIEKKNQPQLLMQLRLV